MKKLLSILFLLSFTLPFISFGQSMDIRWDDSGIEFSINSHTGKLNYSVPGGDIKYNGMYDPGPTDYIKSIGSVNIKYNGMYDPGPTDYIKSVGGLSVKYNGMYDPGPTGSVKSTSGSVR